MSDNNKKNSLKTFTGLTVFQCMQMLHGRGFADPVYRDFALDQIESLLLILEAYSNTPKGISAGSKSVSGSVYSSEWLGFLINKPSVLALVVNDLAADESMLPLTKRADFLLNLQELPNARTGVKVTMNSLIKEFNPDWSAGTRAIMLLTILAVLISSNCFGFDFKICSFIGLAVIAFIMLLPERMTCSYKSIPQDKHEALEAALTTNCAKQ